MYAKTLRKKKKEMKTLGVALKKKKDERKHSLIVDSIETVLEK